MMMLSPTPPKPLALTVYCSSSTHVPSVYIEESEALGRLIAERGHTLVYGGGNIGLMGTLARAVLAANGNVTGVILKEFLDKGYGQAGHEMHVVDDMRARKQSLEELGDAYLVLPGGFGTFEEVSEVLSFKQLGFHTKPIIFVNTNQFFAPLIEQFERAFAEAFIHERFRDLYSVADTPQAALEAIEAVTPAE
jgi:uncharacterized protein (TIGR00730 family)